MFRMHLTLERNLLFGSLCTGVQVCVHALADECTGVCIFVYTCWYTCVQVYVHVCAGVCRSEVSFKYHLSGTIYLVF